MLRSVNYSETVCDPPCQNNSKCVPGFGCICPSGFYGPSCSNVPESRPIEIPTIHSDTPVLYSSANCTDFVKRLENKLPDDNDVLKYFRDVVAMYKLPANTCHELNVLSNAIPDMNIVEILSAPENEAIYERFR